MKLKLSLIALLFPLISAAQVVIKPGSVKFFTTTFTLGVNANTTIYFALPPEIGVTVQPSTSAIDPPDNVSWNGNACLIIKKTSGNTSDSTRILVQGLDPAGTVIDNDNQYVVATATTFVDAAFSNALGKIFQLTGLFHEIYGFAVTFTQGDLTGGSRAYTIYLSVQ